MSQDNPYNSLVGQALAAQKVVSERASAEIADTAARNKRLIIEADQAVKLVVAEAHKANDALKSASYRLTVKENTTNIKGMLSGVELQLTRGGTPIYETFYFNPGAQIKLFRMSPEAVGKGQNKPQDLTQLFGLGESSPFGEREARELVTKIVNQINPDIPSIADQLYDLNALPASMGGYKVTTR